MFKIIKKEGVARIVQIGDLFDRRKYVNYMTLQKTKEIFLDPLEALSQELGIPVDILPGNHDTYFKNTLEVNSLSLNLKGYSFNVVLHPQEIDVGGTSLLLLPWICDENKTESYEAIKNSKARFCLGHLELVGFELHRGNLSTHGDEPALFERFDKVITGHYHHRSHKGNIHYIGAAYEFTWADYNDPRGFVILDVDTGKIDYKNNPYKIFHVYDYDDHNNSTKIEEDIADNKFSHLENCFVKIRINKKVNPYMFDKLVETLQSNNPAKLNIVENVNNFVSDDIEIDLDSVVDTPTLINNYIDSMSLQGQEIDPLDIKSKMASLYQEAITLESVE